VADYIGITLTLVIIAVAIIIGMVVFANVSTAVDRTTLMTATYNGTGLPNETLTGYVDTYGYNASFESLGSNANSGFKLLAVGLIVLAAGVILGILLGFGKN